MIEHLWLSSKVKEQGPSRVPDLAQAADASTGRPSGGVRSVA